MSSWTYKVPTTCTPFTTYGLTLNKKNRRYINRAKLSRDVSEDELTKTSSLSTMYSAVDVVLPENFSWRNSGKIETPRDQGNCGCCWAFATAMALGDRFTIKYNIPSLKLSPTYLLSSTYEVQGNTASNACDNGGYTYDAAKNLEKQGIKSEKCWPYSIISNYKTNQNSYNWKSCNPLPENCCFNCCDSKVVGKECKFLFKAKTSSANNLAVIEKNVVSGKNVYSINPAATIRAIQTDIMLNGPVVAGFEVFNDFMTYWDTNAPKKEVYIYKQSATNKSDGGHAVTITGWGTTTIKGKKVRYWEMRNSWGTDTGDQGYGRVAFSTDAPSNAILELDVPNLQLDYYDPRWKKYRWSGGMVTFLPGSLPTGYQINAKSINLLSNKECKPEKFVYLFLIISTLIMLTLLLTMKN
jgi:C1A family cysteine protease